MKVHNYVHVPIISLSVDIIKLEKNLIIIILYYYLRKGR